MRPRWVEEVAPTPDEVRRRVVGDDLVPEADVVMDRAFTVPAPPDQVWPWLVQLGKDRAGWYLPRPVERFVPRSRRALRRVEPRWQGLAVGDVIPDYGGREEWFRAEVVDPPTVLVYSSRRGRTDVSWAISLTPSDGGTRVHLRLRLAPVRHRFLARTAGGLVDLLTIAGMAAGLRERVAGS
ncbi:SRPBCC family protein [Nocardioides coralli]|uniref:SRPBCC family protein n=1 Tax=Nocardioides coralli TaxID=2872154 RepID=UPI001CA3BB66|nr:hypothetical protein [Nocardioides coralli]QZY29106.1 hypothetical protein K6T13_17030 [Nocardioides coralli]